QLQGFGFRLVEKKGSSVKGNNATNSFIGGLEESFWRQVVDDSVVDFEKADFSLLVLTQCLFRFFSLSNVEKGDNGADGFACTKHGMGPILNRETGTVLPPKNVIVNVHAPVFLKAQING